MDNEQIQSFNERLSQWISSQGFWFQLRYSMAGGVGAAFYHLIRITFRLVIFLLIVAVGGWIYLVKRVESKDYPKQLTAAVGQQLAASESRLQGFRKLQGTFNLKRMTCVGGPDAFFNSLEVTNVTFRMGLLDGLHGDWQPGPIQVRRLDLELRAGSEDPEQSARQGANFLKRYPNFIADFVEVAETNLRWGFTERTRGEIKGSRMSVWRVGDGYRMMFRGGTFSQNWLENLDIVELTLNVGPSGLVVEKGEFQVKRDQHAPGRVVTTNFRVTGGENPDRPTVSGVLEFEKVPLEALIPRRMQGVVEGLISAKIKVTGSTNSSEGIGYEGQAVLSGDDCVTLRDRIPLFRALSVVDLYNSYRKVEFREGSFRFKTLAGQLELSEIDLKASEIMTLQGAIKARPPTDQEVEILKRRGAQIAPSPFFASGGNHEEEVDPKQAENEVVSKRTEDDENNPNGSNPTGHSAGESTVFDRMAGERAEQELSQKATDLYAKNYRFQGGIRITLPGDSFSQAPDLSQMYPSNPDTKRISIDVPIQGGIYDMTLIQAEDIYAKGRRKE